MGGKEIFAGFTREEIELFKKLSTPQKIQDFINSLEINFEEDGCTCMSPKMVLKKRKAHCVEAALLAATILRFHGREPLILDLEAAKDDYDHVVALFKINGYWGSIGKSNHNFMRYRDPIYKSIRELALSCFHEYFENREGRKTLRSYSRPVNLKIFDNKNWMGSEEQIWFIPDYLTEIKHTKILSHSQIKLLKNADEFELKIGSIEQYSKKIES